MANTPGSQNAGSCKSRDYPRPGLERIKLLYESGLLQREIADDPELRRTLLKGIDKDSSRRWKVFHLINAMADEGLIIKRGTDVHTKAPRVSSSSHTDSLDAKVLSFYEQHLADYEKYIGSKSVSRAYRERDTRGRTDTVVISDPHIPDERWDFLAEVARRHQGAHCCLAGDLNDFEVFGRFDLRDWSAPQLQSCLARTDAVLSFLTEHFSGVDVLMGNHDLRIPRKAAKQLGPDFHFISQSFLLTAYEKRHGVKVVHQKLVKENGRQLPGLFFYQQQGDCMIGHVEAAGKPVGKGVEIAHDFFYSRREFLKLEPFQVVLQAHTHKQCYFRHSLTGVHLFEIGCLCDEQAYSLHQPRYGPVQQGYYHLVQYNGVTDLDESRLYSF